MHDLYWIGLKSFWHTASEQIVIIDVAFPEGLQNPRLVLSWIWILCFSQSKLFVDFCKSLVLKPWKLLEEHEYRDDKTLSNGTARMQSTGENDLSINLMQFRGSILISMSLSCFWGQFLADRHANCWCLVDDQKASDKVPHAGCYLLDFRTWRMCHAMDIVRKLIHGIPCNERDCSIHIIGLRVNSQAIPMQGL